MPSILNEGIDPYKVDASGAAPVSQSAEGDDEILRMIERRARAGFRHQGELINQMREEYAFLLGFGQWTTEELQDLKNKGLSPMVFNKISSLIELIGGYQRENATRIKVTPEGGEDRVFSEVIDKALAYIMKQSRLKYKMDQQFDDGISVGKSDLELYLDYDRDPINGDILFGYLGPFKLISDPSSIEYDMSDCDWKIKVCRYSRAKLISMFPDKEAEIKEISNDKLSFLWDSSGSIEQSSNYNRATKGSPGYETVSTSATEGAGETDDLMESRVTYVEMWYKKPVKQFFIYDPSRGKLDKFNTREEAEQKLVKMIERLGQEWQMTLEIKERTVPVMHVAGMAGGRLLTSGVSPFYPRYNGFPFFSFISKYAPCMDTATQRIKGMVRDLRDPAREINKSRVAWLHLLSTVGNTGWIGDEDAFSNDEDWNTLKKFGSRPGLVVRKRQGKQLERFNSVSVPLDQLRRGQEASSDLKDISGINTDALAIQDKTTSGKAIALRIRQAVTILGRVLTNARFTKELIGLAIVQVMPEIMSGQRLARIVGKSYMDNTLVDGAPITEGTLQAYLDIIDDGKYDLSIADDLHSSTIRAEIFESLIELRDAGAPIPVDMMIDYMDVQNSEELKSRIKQEEQKMMAMKFPGGAATAATPGIPGIPGVATNGGSVIPPGTAPGAEDMGG